ncbi:MAG: hypothetical protein KJZ98_07455 [Burkholderiaceae bacterium]|jgi:hypothetical protein|nr:hypothetical protein [Burkholderiaceae bacterium]MEB2351713.1 hypothetical protein [Burkholderiaceae bacterium]
MTGKLGIGDLAAMGLGNVGIGPLKVGNVLDTVDFVKKAWTSFGVPSGFTPTVDLGELDKRIADLKAVEQWLTLNMNLLQGTIQALEIQRGTIATLKAFGAPLGAATPAAQAIASVLGGATQSRAPADSTQVDAAQAGSAETGSAETSAAEVDTAQPGTAQAAAMQGSISDPGLSPTAWWSLLQSQFNQVAAAALAGVGLSGPDATASAQHPAVPAARAPRGGARRNAHPGAPTSGRKPAARTRKA